MKSIRFLAFAAALVAAVCLATATRADVAEFYIGIDARTAGFNAPPALGGGAYPNNPNYNRLTFLYQHGDHYHGIGTYSYTGPAGFPVLNDTNPNNRLPETFTAQPPIPLLSGAGVYAGKNTTQQVLGLDYSNLEARNVHSLDPSIPAELTLFNSSSGRWNQPFDLAHIHLELIGVSSPHLNVGTLTNPNALLVGGDVHVGDGEELFSFTPVLWVDAAAPAGNYWAEFRLLDESGSVGDSGRFFIDVRQVPEPTGLGLGVLAAAAVVMGRRRRRSH